MGEVADADGDVHGLPVIEASRLCAAANGGEVLVADVVRHLAGSRSTHTLILRPPLVLKGFPDPVDACEVLWREEEVSPVWIPRRLVDAARSSCVGREREIEILRDAWASVAAGRRRLALVSGEPGIGKTRLAAELASTAEDSTIAYGWCDHDTAAAFFPWSSVVRSLTHSHPDVLADAVAPTLATEIHRLVPELGPGGLPVAGDASVTRMYLLDAIDTFLAAVSALQPVLVVLDDLHWADGGTLAVIRHLLRSDRDEPLLIVGTYRDTDVDRTHPLTRSLHDLQREPGTVRVSLSGLQRESVGALIADRAGHAASAEFVDLIYDETDGNPYFAEEVLAHLAESGAVVKNVHGEWVNTVPVSEVGVPEGIRDALGRRLSRLPVETNDVLSVAAVVGREFDVVVVGDVLSLARLDVIERLEPALDAGLVHLAIGSSVGSFAHALVRESLLDEMRSTRRDASCTGSSAVRSRRELTLLRRLWRTISARVRWRATSAKLLPRRSTPPQRRTNSAPRRMSSRGPRAPSRSSATTPTSTPNSTTWRSTTGAAPASSTSPATRGRRRTSSRQLRSRSIAGITSWP